MAVSFTILGAGSWGTVMAAHLHDAGYPVTLWHYREEFTRSLAQSHRHPHLEGFILPDDIVISADINEAISRGEILVVATPSQEVRRVMELTANLISNHRVANLSKGIERGTLKRMSEVIAEAGGVPGDRIASIYGPSHAEEVMRKVPTALVAASTNLAYARELQGIFSTHYMRVYANSDIIGVELGGSIKNVIAIAAGICVGLGFGDNTMAALVTRGLTEITRLGVAMGADIHTFAGLSGVGDLAVTVYSRHSRNRRLGVEIGRGWKFEKVIDDMGMVAEGVYTAQSVMDLAGKLQVEMPICREVFQVLFKDKNPRQAIADLMTRDLRDETLP
ncbi:MAG: NAD(P)H-dependent glycerol-3-phosphate dehydrogenase [Candidatus Neomarinimicrobiota bacterium]